MKLQGSPSTSNVPDSNNNDYKEKHLSTPAVIANDSNTSSSSSVTTSSEKVKPKGRSNSVLNNSSNTSKPHWLKLELSSKNNLASNKQQKRQSANSDKSSTTVNSVVRPSPWRKMSINRKNNTRLSLDNSTTGNTPAQVDPLLNANSSSATTSETLLKLQPSTSAHKGNDRSFYAHFIHYTYLFFFF